MGFRRNFKEFLYHHNFGSFWKRSKTVKQKNVNFFNKYKKILTVEHANDDRKDFLLYKKDNEQLIG